LAAGAGRAGVITVIVLVFAVVNLLGVRESARMSNLLTVAKLIPLLVFVAVGVFFAAPERLAPAVSSPDFGSFSKAVLLLVFAFTGFEMAGIPSGEARDPKRHLPFALIVSIAGVTLLYLSIQFVCMETLPGLAGSDKPLAFADDGLREHVWLTPANSINLGRLLPQVFYFFLLAGLTPAGGRGPVVAVPSGNFGNLTAGLIARRIGLAVDRFVAATNVNDAVPVYLRTGCYEPKPSVRTVANAMDVGAPSNYERVQALYGGDHEAGRRDNAGFANEDARVIAEIGRVHREHGYLLDPHSAIAWLAVHEYLRDHPDAQGVILATAHAAKFREVVEPAIGAEVPLPPALAEALTRPRHAMSMPADYAALEDFLRT
jgi:hypothetical protein